MDAQQLETLSVAEQAAKWLRVMKTAGPQEQGQFWRWVAASPSHVGELMLAAKMDEEMRGIDPDRRIDVQQLIARAVSNVSPIRGENESAGPAEKRRISRSIFRTAASFVLIAVTAWSAHLALELRGTYATRLGEQRIFELADGSTVFLNTQSRVKVDFSPEARDVYLSEGQALFQVRHDAKRPFRVHAAQAVIQAIGTQFDVRLDANRAMVAVVEGMVQVSSPQTKKSLIEPGGTALPAPAKITAGKGATIDAGGKIRPQINIDTETVTAWRRQRLVFRGETLSRIAREFNRYNVAPRLRVEGDDLAARRFHGVFNAHNPDSLLKYLAQDETVEINRMGDEVVIRPSADLTPAEPRQALPPK